MIMEDVYHNAIVAASEDEELYKLWNERLKSILHDFGGFGWGMEEYIYDFLLNEQSLELYRKCST